MSTSDGPFAGFGVAVSFVGEQVLLALRGEIDLLTAPEMGALLDAVIDRGHTNVVLDLVGCEFMDAAGLGVIATGASRLGSAGGVLAISSPSSIVTRLLEITGLIGVVHVEQSANVGDNLGPEQSTRHEVARPPASWSTSGRSPRSRQTTM